MTRDEVEEFLRDKEQEAYEFAVQELKLIFRQNANLNLIRKFNDEFKKEEDGSRRDWRKIKEEQIKEMFETSKKKHMLLFEQFKLIMFPQNITSLSDKTPGQEDTFE